MSQPIGMKTKPSRRTGLAGVFASAVAAGIIASSKRQRHRGAHAAQERPSRQSFFGDDHSDFLMVNGVLLATPTIMDEKR